MIRMDKQYFPRIMCMIRFCVHFHILNTLRPRQNGRHFADDILKHLFLNEKDWISIKISLKFVPNGPINNITALVQIMAWRRPGDKPLSEPMMVSLLTHLFVTRPQWVYGYFTAEGHLAIVQVYGNQSEWIGANGSCEHVQNCRHK